MLGLRRANSPSGAGTGGGGGRGVGLQEGQAHRVGSSSLSCLAERKCREGGRWGWMTPDEFRKTEHVDMGLRKAKLRQNGGWGAYGGWREGLVKVQ